MRRQLPNELYLPFDLPVVRQIDVEKGRTMNASEIKVGPFIKIRREPSFKQDYKLRSVTCYKCPSMVGGDSYQCKHWRVHAVSLPDALIQAGAHLKACHSNGCAGEV
jgi:hypothetical protein